ncbi:MAG: gamma-glutamylcyclotransferase [Rhodospirillales bacterium]|nr:gamma-glutamylcyclotransferase [Rhodospirillales bacterium]
MARQRKEPDNASCPPPADGADMWLFAYGSLMWDPGFPFEEARPALLKGFHRAFCLYSIRYRGTPEKPGLVLGLDHGGACRGIAYRIAGSGVENAMSYLWDREMQNQSYICRTLRLHIAGGAVTGRAFVIDRKNPNYARKLPFKRTVELILQGHGQRGTCRAYLENTVRHLDKLGIPDRGLHELWLAVRAHDAKT